MLWEELTAASFQNALDESRGVCVVPLGVIEKHGRHLPLGTDMYTGREVCVQAANKEPAVVFPYYFLGQISEARHVVGTIAASHKLIMETLLEMCDEIHRNGFDKIIVVSSHGGNNYFLPFFTQEMPRLKREYSVYVCDATGLTHEQHMAICKLAGTDDMGYHAGLSETSVIMHIRSDLVHLGECEPSEGTRLNRLQAINEMGVTTGFDWYANYPYHFAGSTENASPEIGKAIIDMSVSNLAEIIRRVKQDNVSCELVKEYIIRGDNPK